MPGKPELMEKTSVGRRSIYSLTRLGWKDWGRRCLSAPSSALREDLDAAFNVRVKRDSQYELWFPAAPLSVDSPY